LTQVKSLRTGLHIHIYEQFGAISSRCVRGRRSNYAQCVFLFLNRHKHTISADKSNNNNNSISLHTYISTRRRAKILFLVTGTSLIYITYMPCHDIPNSELSRHNELWRKIESCPLSLFKSLPENAKKCSELSLWSGGGGRGFFNTDFLL